MPLGDFLQGYNAARQGNQQADSAQLQQATVATGLMGVLQKHEQDKQLRDLLDQSGGDVEKAMAGAIKSGNIAAAHQLAPILKLQQEAKQRQETIQGMRELYGPQAAQPTAQTQESQQLGVGATPSAPPAGSAPSGQDAKHARLAQLQKMSLLYANNPAASTAIQREIDKFQAETKPMIEHAFAVGDNQVQPHISFDQGQTWKPVPGSQPSAKFAKQVAPTINNPAPVSNIVFKDPTSDTGWSYKDARTGRVTSQGAPAPSSAADKLLPPALQKQLTEAAELADATSRFKTTFKDSYGGKTFTGELGNVTGRIFGDDTGQSQWWQDYELHQSQVRNKLFGSALTAPEIEAWNKSAINPRMEARQIKFNLARRDFLEQRAIDRLIKGATAGRYNREQIEGFTGRSAGGPTVPQPSTPQESGGRIVNFSDLK